MEISHGIISTAILSLPLIQLGQLSAVHLVLVNCLGTLHRNSVFWLTVRPDMAIVVDWDVKPHIKQLDKSYILLIHIFRIIMLICVRVNIRQLCISLSGSTAFRSISTTTI